LGFYSSGGYYVGVTLQQLWPVKVGGKGATLIWRVDLVSTGALRELRGVERLGSGAAMMRKIQENVRAFVRGAREGGRRSAVRAVCLYPFSYWLELEPVFCSHRTNAKRRR